MRYDVILFDFDGTLADTAKDVWVSVDYAASLAGGSFTNAFKNYKSNIGLPIVKILQAIEPAVPMEKLEEFDNNITKHYRTISEYEQTNLYPGIEELLQLLNDKQVPCYIVTLKPEAALKRILRKKGWEKYFTGWYAIDSFGTKIKTKDEVIRFLLQTQLQQKRTVYIGDSYTDIIAAKKNHIDCIGVTYGDGDEQKLKKEEPLYVVDTAYEIVDLLKG